MNPMTRFSLILLLLAQPLGFAHAQEACVTTTPAVAGMAEAVLKLGERRVDIKLARTVDEWGAGMQYLCPEAIARRPILFLFPQPSRPEFHMRNVHAPLDIAFVGPDGRVIGVSRMPIGGGAYAPGAAIAVLEARAGAFAEWGLEPGDPLFWARRD